MRKLGWIALVALACACGNDGERKGTADAGPKSDGGRSSGAGCGIEIADYEGYSGPRVWSEGDLAACLAVCPDLTTTCLEASCPGAFEFFGCLDEELYACQTSPGQDCRLEYEDWTCCAYESCQGMQGETLRQCLGDNCSVENSTVEECYVSDTASPSFVTCREAAYDSCLVPIACTPADASPVAHFTSARPWTRAWTAAEYDACIADCAGALSPVACQNETCPYAAHYRACISVETANCTTQQGAECRDEWEKVFCCARLNCANAATNADLAACLETLCPQDYGVFNDCNEAALAGTCAAPAEAACALAEPDAGTPPDSGLPEDDGGVPADDAGPQAQSEKARIHALEPVRGPARTLARPSALPFTASVPQFSPSARARFAPR